MIEKLVALIREKHKDESSLIIADILEEHGDKIANEIVGAALCYLFALPIPPDQGVIFTGSKMDHVDDEIRISFGFITRMALSRLDKDFLRRILEHVGKVVYGESPTFDIRNAAGEIVDRVPLYKKALHPPRPGVDDLHFPHQLPTIQNHKPHGGGM